MVAKNDITGDAIQTRTNTDAYRDNYDVIFGVKTKHPYSNGFDRVFGVGALSDVITQQDTPPTQNLLNK